MTEHENKAIRWMKSVRDDAVVTLDYIAKEEPNVSPMFYAGRKDKAETVLKAFEELEECRAEIDKHKDMISVEDAKKIAAQAICIGCGYLKGYTCEYKGVNCSVSKPMLDAVNKSFETFIGRLL